MTKPKTTKPASPWQPIETAPVTGEYVIAYNGAWSKFPYFACSSSYCDWFDEEGNEAEEPTHWMPIPPLPEGK